MSNFGAIYVHIEGEPEEEFHGMDATLKQQGYLFTLRYHGSTPWVQLWMDEPENVPYYTKTIAQLFPSKRVIGIAVQSVMDAISYCEFSAGREERILEYGLIKERVWEKVEGKPREWEKTLFKDRSGYTPGSDPCIGIGEPYFSSFDVQTLGNLIGLPGFGIPAHGEKWTLEIFN